MAWTVLVDLNLSRVVQQTGGDARIRLTAVVRLIQRVGPEALGAAPVAPMQALPAKRHIFVPIGHDIVFVTLEILPESTVIVRNAWSFSKPDWY